MSKDLNYPFKATADLNEILVPEVKHSISLLKPPVLYLVSLKYLY